MNAKQIGSLLSHCFLSTSRIAFVVFRSNSFPFYFFLLTIFNSLPVNTSDFPTHSKKQGHTIPYLSDLQHHMKSCLVPPSFWTSSHRSHQAKDPTHTSRQNTRFGKKPLYSFGCDLAVSYEQYSTSVACSYGLGTWCHLKRRDVWALCESVMTSWQCNWK